MVRKLRRRRPRHGAVTVGVEAHTHEFIATGDEDQKFGFSSRGARRSRRRARAGPARRFDLRGLHSHIGSQIFDTGGFEMAARRLVGPRRAAPRARGRLAPLRSPARPRRRLRHRLPGRRGRRRVPQLAEDSLLDHRRARAPTAARPADVPPKIIAVEPGRVIAGPGTAGRPVRGGACAEGRRPRPLGTGPRYVSVDGGMSHKHPHRALRRVSTTAGSARGSSRSTASARPRSPCVVGKHGESGDIVGAR